VGSPEDFALLVCNHFLYTYRHVAEASVHVEEYPWERLQVNEQDHNHAFIFSPIAFRFCTVTQKRNSESVYRTVGKCRVQRSEQTASVDAHKNKLKIPNQGAEGICCLHTLIVILIMMMITHL
jgi:urate oxidase